MARAACKQTHARTVARLLLPGEPAPSSFQHLQFCEVEPKTASSTQWDHVSANRSCPVKVNATLISNVKQASLTNFTYRSHSSLFDRVFIIVNNYQVQTQTCPCGVLAGNYNVNKPQVIVNSLPDSITMHQKP